MKKSEEKTNTEISYGLNAIHTSKFSISLPKIKYNISGKELLDYSINPIVKFNVEKSLIVITIEVFAIIKETKERIMDAEIVFFYNAKDLKNYVVFNEEKKWSFINSKDIGLTVVLIGISFSTMRGILLERCRGTVLEAHPLPIVDPKIFLEPDK